MKKRISIFLCLAAAVGLLCFVMAMGRTREVPLSEKDAAAYARYELDTAALPGTSGTLCDRILELCTLDHITEISDQRTTFTYTSDALAQYIPLYQSDLSVEVSSAGPTWVSYDAADGCRVFLTYMDDELRDKVIYDEAKDTAFIQDSQPARLVKNFRNGGSTRYFHILGVEIAVPIPAWWPQ